MSRTLLYVGGGLNVLAAILHVAFWRILRWKKELATLSPENRMVMQLLNIAVICAMLLFAWVSFFHAPELLGTGLGRAVTAGIGGLYLVRSIAGLGFGEHRTREDLVIQLFLLLIIGSYAVPLLALIGDGS